MIRVTKQDDYSLTALIGYTGFVGENILNQKKFDCLYNSKNIKDIQKRTFDLIVCAGISGTKWIANSYPKKDMQSIERLMKNLQTVKAKKFVLISTIDVYSTVDKVDETSYINKNELSSYGNHRKIFEEFIENNFDYLIIRLPGLFGKSLKKNIIYDYIQGTAISIDIKSLLQFYCLDHIWEDIKKSLENDLKIVNFATEPITGQELMEKVFKIISTDKKPTQFFNYNMHTKYGNFWSNNKPYIHLKKETLEELKKFIKSTSLR
jgi:nucleoside-diphosphate-sugar epimerase